MTKIAALPPKSISSIDGVTICLAGSFSTTLKTYSYENMAKADPQTGKCSDLFVPCSEHTSVLNTICVRPSEHPLFCPVTDVRIVPKDRVDEFLPGYATYSQAEPPADISVAWALFYSKDFDSPPVRDFQFESAPTCNGKRIGDPANEMLGVSINKKLYQNDCPKAHLDVRKAFKSAFNMFSYSEYDFLE